MSLVYRFMRAKLCIEVNIYVLKNFAYHIFFVICAQIEV